MDMMLSIPQQSKSMFPISMTMLRVLIKNHMLDKLPNIPHQVCDLLHRLFDQSVEPLRIVTSTDRTIISIMITVSYEIYHVII